MESRSTFVIESRLQLFSALAEAAEVEHNLMCLYLYAMFSLKRSTAEGVSPEELVAIERWRKVILSVALEEMTHLTLVSNLMSSIGGSPHFMRPNFPTSPGLYPAEIVIELAPFDMATLDHFIFLERPRNESVSDGASFQPTGQYTRVSPKGRLMPTSGDYQTVGALYLSIRDALESLSQILGEAKLFCGATDRQIGPLDSALPGLTTIKGTSDALRAVDTIIAQGEGGQDIADSHFRRFRAIKDEYEAILARNPKFVPARAVPRNPVMRKPLNPQGRVWVSESLAAGYLDLANALYGLMLRTLVQVYAIEARPKEAKAALLQSSFTLMHALSSVAETLTHLPASEDNPTVMSGVSFAMVRSLAPIARQTEKPLLVERIGEFTEILGRLQVELERRRHSLPRAAACLAELPRTAAALESIRRAIASMPDERVGTASGAIVRSSGGATRE